MGLKLLASLGRVATYLKCKEIVTFSFSTILAENANLIDTIWKRHKFRLTFFCLNKNKNAKRRKNSDEFLQKLLSIHQKSLAKNWHELPNAIDSFEISKFSAQK